MYGSPGKPGGPSVAGINFQPRWNSWLRVATSRSRCSKPSRCACSFTIGIVPGDVRPKGAFPRGRLLGGLRRPSLRLLLSRKSIMLFRSNGSLNDGRLNLGDRLTRRASTLQTRSSALAFRYHKLTALHKPVRSPFEDSVTPWPGVGLVANHETSRVPVSAAMARKQHSLIGTRTTRRIGFARAQVRKSGALATAPPTLMEGDWRSLACRRVSGAGVRAAYPADTPYSAGPAAESLDALRLSRPPRVGSASEGDAGPRGTASARSTCRI